MRIIFYHPAPIRENATSASGIRPFKMLSAFKNAGFIVDTVCGYPQERASSIRLIKEKVAQGIKYDFAYGENTTYPFPLSDPYHKLKYLCLDYAFWRWLKKNKIPFGCFYRDIFWRFSAFTKKTSLFKRLVFYFFHYLDVLLLKQYTASLFLPSVEMSPFLPFKFTFDHIQALPPGCEIEEQSIDSLHYSQETLNLFYVGGILPPLYNLSAVLNFFSTSRTNSKLTLCCREKEWELVEQKKIYDEFNFREINLVHKQGVDLREYWNSASVFLALWENLQYLDFAVPFKLFEAIGYGVPIITTRDTAAGRIVETNNLGWAIAPTVEEFACLMRKIQNNPKLLEEKRRNILAVRKNHTWEARINKVVEVLIRK